MRARQINKKLNIRICDEKRIIRRDSNRKNIRNNTRKYRKSPAPTQDLYKNSKNNQYISSIYIGNEKSPFLKWAGGKRQLLSKIRSKMPRDYKTYYEPFIGGGALLLDVSPVDAVISDVNEQLINVYQQIKSDPIAVIREVNKFDSVEECDKEYYYDLRNRYNEKIINHEMDAECAALMIWLNKHCFNGLYRVNSKGLFNVPYNNKRTGKSIDEANILNIADYLRNSNISIICQDFEETCSNVQKGDFVYFDSPYAPVSETASFTDYTKDGFSYEDHKRLAGLFRRLDRAGAKVMLSNHDVELIHELYEGYRFEGLDVRRSINSDADKRIGREVLITNY